MAANDELIIGIDLGTTNSLAASVGLNGPLALRDKAGRSLIPSVITVKGKELIVGADARRMAEDNPLQTVFSVKRLMGKSMDDLQRERRMLPYELVDEGGIARVKIDGKLYSPQELSARILQKVKAVAEEALGRPVKKAVVTVPAYFDDNQRQATRDAGRIAGLDVVRIVNEPTAAALAYGLDKKKQGTVVVYDLGGGTFDVSVLRIEDGVFRVLSTAGDTALGGDDFDRHLMALMIRGIHEQAKFDVHRDPSALHAVKQAAEEAKKRLSVDAYTELSYISSSRKIHFSKQVSRTDFEAMIAPLVEKSLDCCRRALADAGVEAGAVDDVVLVGGSTRVPCVRRKVKEVFGREPHAELNPDEVVALGAAVQAHILAGGTRDYLLLDVTPLSLGIETVGDAFSKIILRNASVPCSVSEEFSTSIDNQTAVTIHVLQGERELVKDCRSLGTFKLGGLPPMPAGYPRIEVNFSLDANGVLTVRAMEKRTSKEASITITPAHGLTSGEVDRIIDESIEHAMDDFNARKVLELKNKANTILVATGRSLPRAREAKLVDAAELDEIESVMAQVKAFLAEATPDPDAFEALVDRFGAITAHLAEELMNAAVQRSFEGKTLADLK